MAQRYWFSRRFHTFLCKAKYPIAIFWAISLGAVVYMVGMVVCWLNSIHDQPTSRARGILWTKAAYAHCVCLFATEGVPHRGVSEVSSRSMQSPSNVCQHQEAQAVLEREFPEFAWHAESIVFFQGRTEHDTVVIPEVATASKDIVDWFWRQSAAQALQVEGYDYFYDQGLYRMANQFKTVSNHSSLIVMTTNGSETADSDAFAVALRKKMDDVRPILKDTAVDMSLVGMPAMLHDAQSVAETDLARMDIIVIPIAMAVLAYILASVRLMIIPLLTMGTRMSAVIAMSIDYSLFLLRRFREEVENGRETVDCVKIMTRTAGETIFISGLTISICFFGLAFFPMDILMSIGVGTGIAIMITLMVNLTLTPSLLLMFPTFFRSFVTINTWHWLLGMLCCRPKDYRKAEVADGADHGVSKKGSKRSSPPKVASEEDVEPLQSEGHHPVMYDPNVAVSIQADALPPQTSTQRRSYWNRLGQVLVQWPVIIFIIFVAICIPFVMHAMRLTVTLDQNQFIPTSAESSQALARMEKEFSAGFIYPMTLSISTGKANGIKNQEFFDNSVLALKIIVEKLGTDRANMSFFNGITYADNQEVPFPFVKLWLDMPNKPPYHSEQGRSYRLLWSNLVNNDNSSTVVMITTTFDPMTFDGKAWLKQFRSILKHDIANVSKEEAEHPFQLYDYHLSGAPEIIADMVDSVYALFPIMMAVTICVVYAIAATMFQSVFVPFRMTITLGLTCALVFGLSVFVYDDGLLYHIVPDMANYPYVFWVVPPLAFPIIIGLGLDYDVFLTTRIVEYHKLGFSTRASILNGLYKTGGIITAAGVIMCIAFSGLMFSHMIVLNQFSFYLVTAYVGVASGGVQAGAFVLLDTFLIRTILVPVIMAMAGRWNWWPRKMPDEHFGDALAEETEVLED